MFVYTLKATTLKYIGVMVLSVVAVVLTVALVPSTSMSKYRSEEVETVAKTGDFKNIKTLSDREAFLNEYGWTIDPDSEKVSEIVIPEEFDEVYSDYNEIQLSQGLNLEKYKGKKAKCYTYNITNYENNTPAIATITVYKNRIIASDVSSPEIDGFRHGLTKSTQ